MNADLIITIICLIFQGERALLDTFSIFDVLFRRKNIVRTGKKSESRELFVLIPALTEQEIIVDTIRTMLETYGRTVQIVIITTEREAVLAKKNADARPSTSEVVRQALNNGPLKTFRGNVRVLHYPSSSGRMAHQINFALRQLSIQYPDAHFVLYNADSIPSPESINKFQDVFDRHPDAVVQQPCAFIRDAGKRATGFVNALSLFQTLFCIGHETALIRRYAPRLRDRKSGCITEFLHTPLGWIVGHGSAMSIRICLRYGGYPEKYMNEDLTFGYILSAHQVPIYSISALEIADVPTRWSNFIRQKTVWFWNFLEFIRCYQDLGDSNVPNGRRMALLFIGFGRGMYWMFSSIFFGLPLMIGIAFQDRFIFVLGVAGILCFSFLPILLLKTLLPQELRRQGLMKFEKRIRSISTVKMLFALPIIVLSDSIGPWIATVQWIRWRLTSVLPNKPKTD